MDLKNQLTKTPYLVLFIILISVGVGTASAVATYTFTGNLIVDGTITADEYFDNGNTQTGPNATALGGFSNVASGNNSAIGGGKENIASGRLGTIGGGAGNVASHVVSTVGGGNVNQATGLGSTIGGGGTNLASDLGATVGGGRGNNATGLDSFIGGGFDNVANGEGSAILGGQNNFALGDHSVAAGLKAKANHAGSFVFADSADIDFASTKADQFSIRADNGLRLVGGPLDCTGCVNGTTVADGTLTSDDFAANSITGDQINGTSKLLFRECQATFTNVTAGGSDVGSCTINGLAQDDNVVVSDNTQLPNCFVFNGLSTSLGNSQLLQISMENVCGSTSTATIDFSVIIFRVN